MKTLAKILFAGTLSALLMVAVPFFQLIKSGWYRQKAALTVVETYLIHDVTRPREKPKKPIKPLNLERPRSTDKRTQAFGRFALDLTPAAFESENAVSVARAGAGAYKTWEVDVRAQEKRVVIPQYPRAAQEKEIEGRVVVEITINERGTVEQVSVLEEEPQGLGFGLAAAEAARQWEFEPALIAGVPVKYTFRRPVEFKLN